MPSQSLFVPRLSCVEAVIAETSCCHGLQTAALSEHSTLSLLQVWRRTLSCQRLMGSLRDTLFRAGGRLQIVGALSFALYAVFRAYARVACGSIPVEGQLVDQD